MTKISDKYKRKIDALRRLIVLTKVDIRTMLTTKYEGVYFEDSDIPKDQTLMSIIDQYSSTTDQIAEQAGEYLTLRASRGDLGHHRDRRPPLDYAVDLILGWISEDILHEMLKSNGFNVVLAGGDRNREILPGKFVSTTADFLISFNLDTMTPVELMVDYLGYWAKANECDVRAEKIERLMSQGGVFLGLDPSDATNDANCLLHNFQESSLDGWYLKPSHPPYGGKRAWTMTEIDQRKISLTKAVTILKSFT